MARRSRAQGATPASGSGLDYPEVQVTVTDQALTVSPTTVPAGLVLLTVINQTSDQISAGVLGPPAGQSMEEFMTSAQATPSTDEEMPSFLYQATIPGGPGDAGPGKTSQAVINLTPGDWAVFSEGNQQPAMLTASSGTPAAQAPPPTTVTVTEQEFAFLGLDQPVPAGPQFWEVVNRGQQPHMLLLGKVPAGTTLQQVMDVINLNLPDNATPPPGMLQDKDVDFTIGGVLMQSTGQTVYPRLDLAPGRYVALCFVPDPATGQPHAAEGMVSLFDVGSAGATPTG